MEELIHEVLALPPQASTFAEDLDLLHYALIGTTMVGVLVVAAFVLTFAIRHRIGRVGGVPGDALPQPRMPAWIEVAAVGFLAVFFVSVWLVGVRQYNHMRTPPDDALEVWVVAKQWMWKFTDGEGRSSETRLVVPVGRPVALVMTSRDVIHSFYVPAFRIKQDVIPGRYTTTWFEATEPGVYPILCAEYCGTEHSRMRGEVVVLDAGAWARRQGQSEVGTGELAEVGERVAGERGCLRCHTTDGSPHIGPSFAGLYRATIVVRDGRRIEADDAYLTESMMDPLAEVHAGFAPVMPSYRGVLDPGETAALVELIRALADRPRWDDESDAPEPAPTDREPLPAAVGLPRYPAARRPAP